MYLSEKEYTTLIEEKTKLEKEVSRLSALVPEEEKSCHVGALCVACEYRLKDRRYMEVLSNKNELSKGIARGYLYAVNGRILCCSKRFFEMCPDFNYYNEKEQ